MLEGKYSTRRQFVKAIDRAIVVAPGPKTSKVNSLHKLMPCAVYSYQNTWVVGCRFFVFVSCSSASTSAGNHRAAQWDFDRLDEAHGITIGSLRHI
jgi:hypothetical protein